MFSEVQKEKFKTFFESCISNRIYESVEDFSRTKKYQDFTHEVHNIYAELEKTLSEESMSLVGKYGDAHTSIAVDEYDYLYRQGAMDCWMLMNSLNNEGGKQI